MRPFKISVCLLTFLTCARMSAYAAIVYALPGDDLIIPVRKGKGTVIEFPSPVSAIPGERHSFSWREIVTWIDEETKKPIDVRLFQVKAVAGAKNEKTTVLLANGAHISVELLPAKDDAGEDHYQIKLPSRASVLLMGGSFLEQEKALLRALFHDKTERTLFSRTVVKRPFSLPGQSQIEGFQVREFHGLGLTGWTLLLTNRSDETLDLSPALVDVKAPWRAKLLHVEKRQLPPCPKKEFLPWVRDITASCQAVVHLVFQSQTPFVPATAHHFPFVLKPRGGERHED